VNLTARISAPSFYFPAFSSARLIEGQRNPPILNSHFFEKLSPLAAMGNTATTGTPLFPVDGCPFFLDFSFWGPRVVLTQTNSENKAEDNSGETSLFWLPFLDASSEYFLSPTGRG